MRGISNMQYPPEMSSQSAPHFILQFRYISLRKRRIKKKQNNLKSEVVQSPWSLLEEGNSE